MGNAICNYKIEVKGATVKVIAADGSPPQQNSFPCDKVPRLPGVVSILPSLQIVLGQQFSDFINALNLSRIPVGIRKTISNNGYEVHSALRLSTGSVDEGLLGSIHVYKGYIIGFTYNKELLKNRAFRYRVGLSAAHQIYVRADTNDSEKKALSCINILTNTPESSMTITKTAKNLKVRVPFYANNGMPEYYYYTFTLDKTKNYGLYNVMYDTDEAFKRIEILLKLKSEQAETTV